MITTQIINLVSPLSTLPDNPYWINYVDVSSDSRATLNDVKEILNELSNIIGDAMQDIDDTDMASIQSYIFATVIPYFQNKFF